MVEKALRQPPPRPDRGLTIIELLVVMSIVGILMAVGTKPFLEFRRDSAVRADAEKVRTDLEWARTQALRLGGVRIETSPVPSVRLRKVFVVFDTANNGYRVYRWDDTNGNNRYDSGESTQILPDGGGWQTLSYGSFSWTEEVDGVNPAPCGESTGSLPSAAVAYRDAGTGIPTTEPCNGDICVRFDANGFADLGEGAYIFVSNADKSGGTYKYEGTHTYALTLSQAGVIRTCKWDSVNDQWKVTR